jgi:hypothetical protein
MTLDGPLIPLLVLVMTVGLVMVRGLFGRHTPIGDVAVVIAIVSTAMWLEWQMGRTPSYEHGPVRLWSGDINSDQNSQQIFDPYSFTHVIHGAAFYGLTRLVAPAAPFAAVATTVVALEAAWESYENTNQVINRYREETLALGYVGDSIINSFFDIVCCVIGMVLARRSAAWVTVSWVVGVEIVLALWIRDNLTLNIIMLIHPVAAIKTWQMGA